MKLLGYWRSSASYRVRIALNLKGLTVDHVPVNLKDGVHREADYSAINPQKLVPTLELDNGRRLTQSAAIIEYLDEAFEGAPLLPEDPVQRADVRSVMAIIGGDTAPIQNLRVLKYLRGPLEQPEPVVQEWARHWIATGLESLEAMVAGQDSPFLFTGAPSAAECFLIPQLYNARRFGVDLSGLTRLRAVEANCQALTAFEAAKPENQADATAA